MANDEGSKKLTAHNMYNTSLRLVQSHEVLQELASTGRVFSIWRELTSHQLSHLRKIIRSVLNIKTSIRWEKMANQWRVHNLNCISKSWTEGRLCDMMHIGQTGEKILCIRCRRKWRRLWAVTVYYRHWACSSLTMDCDGWWIPEIKCFSWTFILEKHRISCISCLLEVIVRY